MAWTDLVRLSLRSLLCGCMLGLSEAVALAGAADKVDQPHSPLAASPRSTQDCS